MTPGVGLPEILVLAIVALVVVGPRQLPALMRNVGDFLARARAMAREFRDSFDEMGRQADLDALRQEIAEIKRASVMNDVTREVQAAASEARDAADPKRS